MNLKEEYVKLQIEKYLKKTGKKPIDLITGCLISEEERYKLAAEISDTISGLSIILNVSDRTVYRFLVKYGIEIKKDNEKD